MDLPMDDFVRREGLFYKKFTEVPFTGMVAGKAQGKIRNGKRYGPWVDYHENGQLGEKGTHKDGKADGPWVGYYEDGTVDEEDTGTYKDGVKVK